MNFLENDQNVSETLIEGTDYIVYKDGHGYELKYINLNNPKYVPRTGIVEIKQMRNNLATDGKRKHNQEIPLKRYTDAKTGLLWGIPKGVNNGTKNMNHEIVLVDGDMLFDRSIKRDAILCAMILNGPFVEGSPNQVGKPLYKMYSKEAEAEKSVNKRSIRRTCEDIIESMLKQDKKVLEEMARNIGVNVEANKYGNMLLDEVYRIMENDPRKFLEIYNSPNREYITVLNRAISKGIIKEDFSSGSFMYGAIHLGYSKDAAINHLVETPSMASTISVQCDAVDKGTKESMKFVKTDANDEIAALKAKIAALEKEKGVSSVITNVVGAGSSFEDSLTEEGKEENDLIKLREQAKLLNIKGYGVMKADALLRKIAEAEEA